ncbi:MAG: adenylate cyclase [Gammaproteobacteria bacterium]|jgi:adenylate cyclase
MMSGDLEARYQMESPGPWERFTFLQDLQQRGVTDYVVQLVLFGATERARVRQDGCILTWATDTPGGFAGEQVTVLRRLGLRFGVLAKLDRRERTAQNIVSAYLGAEAGRRVLDG